MATTPPEVNPDTATTDPTPAAPGRLAKLESAVRLLWPRTFPPLPQANKSAPRWKSFILTIGPEALIALGGLLLLVVLLDTLAHALAGGADWLNADATGLVLDPVRSYINFHAVGVRVDADTIWWTWCATGVVFFLLSTATRNLGARIGWTLHGAATAGMVWANTPALGRTIAVGVTAAVWCALSVLALRRSMSNPHVVAHVPDMHVVAEVVRGRDWRREK